MLPLLTSIRTLNNNCSEQMYLPYTIKEQQHKAAAPGGNIFCSSQYKYTEIKKKGDSPY
jgi:hypothetical protein